MDDRSSEDELTPRFLAEKLQHPASESSQWIRRPPY